MNALVRRIQPLLFALTATLCLASAPASSQELSEPGFVIRTAFTDLVDGTHLLYADIDYGLGDSALDALENGVPLTFEVEVVVIRARAWWFDQEVIEINQQYELVYHPLPDSFVIRNLNTGRQTSYLSFRSAATELGRISEMPIIDDAVLNEGDEYQVRLRVRLVVEAFSGPVRWVAMLFPRWRLVSEWYAWTLRS
ncbi:MAG: DUF4390 domain-containing protein [Gammaproteobacteria bacterium]